MPKIIKGNLQKVQITIPQNGDSQNSKLVDKNNPIPVTIVGGSSGGGSGSGGEGGIVNVVVNKSYARKEYVENIEGAIEGDTLIVSTPESYKYYILVQQEDDSLKFEYVTDTTKEEE